MSFTEAQLEEVFTELLAQEGYAHLLGAAITRQPDEVLIEDDLRSYLQNRYANQGITANEIASIIQQIKRLPSSDLYESNKTFLRMLSDGFTLKRDDRSQKDIYIQLINYAGLIKQRQPRADELITVLADNEIEEFDSDNNIYKFVTQLEITGNERRIPDGIVYINGLPLVVFEFKSAVREEPTIYNAYEQLTVRYKRDIPELFKYNAFCVISDGINNKAGSFFAPYEFFYGWRRVQGLAKEVDGFDSMFTLVQGMFNRNRIRDIIRNFIYIPDKSKKSEKYVCRYPQYYAARALYDSIKKAQKPVGSGKGGIYFGATGCGKSFTMLYLTRLLMKSEHFESPTIVLITDRTDLDDQLSEQFVNAKKFIGDELVESVESRADLRKKLQGRQSGGVFLTTIHKFTEDTELLTDRTNVICISDEAHRSQLNLDQKISVTAKGVTKTFGFAKYLHDSLPNATYVGFTGTPIDASLDVFGKIVDAYTMTESVMDEITVRIVYEGRAAKVLLHNNKLQEIEDYYARCEEMGSNPNQVEQSKQEMAQMYAIIGDPTRLKEVAKDFVNHYENRVSEGATVKGKAMFVCSTREIAYQLYKNIIELRPEWNEIRAAEDGAVLTEKELKELKPIERIKLVATRGQDDAPELYELLGTKEYRKELDRQFKNEKSNFKIAIVVDMWLTGFDVPFLDSIYIDKFIQRHNLIQTISRVNRRFEGKEKGLVVDYIGIKTQMNLALKIYNEGGGDNVEDIEASIVIVKDHINLLDNLFHTFDSSNYFQGNPMQKLQTLNLAVEFVQETKELEVRFMGLVKRLKAAYDICAGSEKIVTEERNKIHFFFAVRSIIFKLTRGDAPDTAQMNAKVREMIKEALNSEGVEELFTLGDGEVKEQDIFDREYLERIEKIKLPNTKIKLLQQLLSKAIQEIRKVNKVKGIDFTKKMQALVERYNNRNVNDVLRSEVYEEIAEALTTMLLDVQNEFTAGEALGIDFEEKAFYDILRELCIKYGFTYPEDKMINLAKAVKELVDSQAQFPDFNKREDIKAALKAELTILMDEHGYPPVERDEVYQEIFEQAENFKNNRG
jgi:type I restriction enzyme R subunit